MDKNALELLLHSYNFWMGVSTIAVATGILGEYVAHFIFEEQARRNKLEMAVSVLFGVLVLGGVVGEYIFGEKLSQVATQIQRLADTEIAASNQRTEEARKEAEIARKEADSFELQIANAQRDAALANDRAEAAKEASAQLTQRFARRQLTDAQVRTLAEKLKTFGGQQFAIGAYSDVRESREIASRIYVVLSLAGWSDLKNLPRSIRLLAGLEGVLVSVNPNADQHTKEAANTLVASLNAEGIETKLIIDARTVTQVGQNGLLLAVGIKPGIS